jgi:hypothetical protein
MVFESGEMKSDEERFVSIRFDGKLSPEAYKDLKLMGGVLECSTRAMNCTIKP